MRLATLTAGADTCARLCAIALGFAIPISVALDNILLALLLVSFIAAGRYREKWTALTVNPVAMGALALMGILTIGLSYGERYAGDALRYWAKYIDLAFVPVFIATFRERRTRDYALKALGGALLASLIVSFFSPLGLLFGNPLVPANSPDYPVGFKYSITQSLLVAFGAFICIVVAREVASRAWRRMLYVVAALAVLNVLAVIISRTGYLVLAALLTYFFVARYRWRGVAVSALAGSLLFVTAYFASASFHQRVQTAYVELQATEQGGGGDNTSIGTRVAFWRSSVKIIAEHPFFGAGTGSFPAAYTSINAGKHVDEAPNPHNEFLLIAVQTGIIGLAALLYLFYTQWRVAARLEPFYRDLARGLVITFAIGCLFNSLLLDHTEGLFFAWMTGLCFASLPPDDKSRLGT